MANPFVSPYDPKPYLTYLYGLACLIVTASPLTFPRLENLFLTTPGAADPWHLLTASLSHGFPLVPPLLHLTLQLLLLLVLGPMLERTLGSWRFGCLVVAGIVTNAVVCYLSPVAALGASGVIWIFGPAIYLLLREARITLGAAVRRSAKYQILGNLLVLMYVIAPLIMTAVPYLTGFRGNLLQAFIMGNMVHLLATLIGIVALPFLRRRIQRRLHHLSLGAALAPEGITGGDTLAIGVAIAANSILLTVALLALV